MKTVYSKPMVEKIEFDYQIATAGSGSGCYTYNTWHNNEAAPCDLTSSTWIANKG